MLFNFSHTSFHHSSVAYELVSSIGLAGRCSVIASVVMMESTRERVDGSEDANHYGVSNNTALVRLDPDSMLRNVQVRFEEAFREAKRRAIRCSTGDTSGIQFLGEGGSGSSIYTWTGSVLLAINPYQHMNVYDVEYVRYHYSKNLNQADPHPFAIASHAYRQLSKTRMSQSIIISGESGAGKTESSKHVMRFLTMLDETFIKNGVSSRSNRDGSSGRSTLDDRILGTNPILEAFGNAKTVRNDNSSRFGKLMKLNYTLPSPTTAHNAAKPVIKSASIDTYLLARSRVTHTGSTHERSYHIFYLLCAGVRDEEKRRQLRLEASAADYSYLTPCKGKGPAKVRDMDDAVAFDEVVGAFTKLGVSEAEQMEIFSVVSAVMKLGNIRLYPDEANPEGKTRTDEAGKRAAEDVAALLGMEQLSEPFIEHLTRQRLVVGGNKDITWADVAASKATTVRDAMAKSLYVKVFDYVVELLNEKLQGDSAEEAENVNPNPQSPTTAPQERSICILDIFGFENLARNSLEQLCINFANERLNEYFTENVVLSEREEYHQEHIQLPDLAPPDNRPTINVISSLSPPGIFEQLRVVTVDYMIRPLDKDYDDIFMSRLAPVAAINWRKDESTGGRTQQRVLKCVGPQHPRLFIVNHYAEPVTYSTEGFIEKNKDCDRNVTDLLSLSTNDFIQKLISGSTKAIETDSDGEAWPEFASGRMSVQPSSRMSLFGRPAGRSMSVVGSSRMSVARGGGGVATLNYGGAAASKKCIASEFAKQVDVLLEDLKATRSHYIRCIKPNDDQLPGVLEPKRVFKQLEVTGMFTVLVLMAHAYPTRIPYADLFDRYKSMLPGHILGLLMRSGRGGGARLFVEQMLEVVANEERLAGRDYAKGKEFALGTSKVFFRPQSVEPVDSLLAAIDCDVAKRNRVAQAIASSIIRRRRYRQQCYIRTGGRLLIIQRRRQNYWKWFHNYFLRITAIVTFIRRRLLPSIYEKRRIREAAACKIQRHWRARRERRRREAALVIVSRLRCYLAKKMLKERAQRRRVCSASAVTIQCAWRQRTARRELRRRFNANEEAKRRRAEIERMKELQREKEVAEQELREARELIERKEEESAAVCQALVKQEEEKTIEREKRGMALADWEARQAREADVARAREEIEKTRLMEERASLEASLAEERARFQTQLAAEKARVEAEMAEEKAKMERNLAEERAAIEAERARNEEEKRRIEAERAQEAAMAEALRLQQIELDREKTELEQVKLATSMGPVSSPGDSDASVVKREQELLAEREEEIARLRAEVEAFRMKQDAEMKIEEEAASSKRAHSPALDSVPPAKRSRSNSSELGKGTPMQKPRALGDVPMMSASPLAFTPGRGGDRSESRLESAGKARRAARADYSGGVATAVNRREQLQRLERMYNSTEKERRLKAMRESALWIDDDSATSPSPIKAVGEDHCGGGECSMLDIPDQGMCEAKPQTKWETEPSGISEATVTERKIWTREQRNSCRLTSEISISSIANSESHIKQPRARVAAKGARARAASANTSAACASRSGSGGSIPARAVRNCRAAAAVYEHENISGISNVSKLSVNQSRSGLAGKGRGAGTRMQPPGFTTVKGVARGSASNRAISAPVTGRRGAPESTRPDSHSSRIGRGKGTLRTAAATSSLPTTARQGKGVTRR